MLMMVTKIEYLGLKHQLFLGMSSPTDTWWGGGGGGVIHPTLLNIFMGSSYSYKDVISSCHGISLCMHPSFHSKNEHA